MLALEQGSGQLRVSAVASSANESSYEAETFPSIVADAYPSAEVIGVDLSPIQPRWSVSFLFRLR